MSTTTTKWTELPIPSGFNVIKEGTASVLVPDGNQVFYNEVQEFNRDLSILVISQFSTNLMEERANKAQLFLQKQEEKRLQKKATTTTTESTTIEQPTKKQKQSPDLTSMNDTTNMTTTSSSSTNAENQLVCLGTELKTCQDKKLPPRLQYHGVRIFEALSASGLRSIRYYNEIPYVDTIHVNDMDVQAVESIRRNVIYNQLPIDKVIPNRNEATAALYANRATTRELVSQLKANKESNLPPQPDNIDDSHPLAFLYKHSHIETTSLTSDFKPQLPLWNVVDLDPYGSAAPFLDAAIQAVQDDGLLCVTCTDGAILCGNYPETGFGKYNSIPLHSNDISKEFGLRMLLHTIESTASKYGRSITPLLSLSIDFYVRVFVKVTTSPLLVKFSGSRHCMVGQCVGCRTCFTSQCMIATPAYDPNLPISQQTGSKFTHGTNPLPDTCDVCQSRIKVHGPIWSDPIHNQHFVQQCLQTLEHRQYRGLLQETPPPAVATTSETETTSETTTTTTKTTNDKTPPFLHITPLSRITKKFGTYQRLKGMLTMAHSELPTITTLPLASIAQALCLSTAKLDVILSALLNGGYQISETHTAPNNIKTNAPMSYFMDIIRAHVVVYGSITKPWESCSPFPRAYIANNNVLDAEGNPVQFTEDELKLVETFKADELNQPLIAYQEFIQKNYNLQTEADTTTTTTTPTIKSHSSNNVFHLRHEFFTRYESEKKPSQQQLLSRWILSQPIKSQISFKPHERTKIQVFFDNPTAFWGPKAAAGSFDTRNYTNLTLSNDNTGDSTKNISRALALAQHQRALENQGGKRRNNNVNENNNNDEKQTETQENATTTTMTE